jgi:hypothetical protein
MASSGIRRRFMIGIFLECGCCLHAKCINQHCRYFVSLAVTGQFQRIVDREHDKAARACAVDEVVLLRCVTSRCERPVLVAAHRRNAQQGLIELAGQAL